MTKAKVHPPPGPPVWRPALARLDDCLRGCRELLSNRGLAPGSRIARNISEAYRSLDPAGRASFFDALAREFSVATDALVAAAAEYCANQSDINFLKLRTTSEAPRQELFRRLNAAPQGTGLLVDIRHRLLEGLQTCPSWAPVEADLSEVLRAVFNRGLLEFQQIDWETPAPILEKLIEHEAVHEIHDWSDLRRRLDADRRCYALFHPSWPGEPLIFTEVALTLGVPSKVEMLVNPGAPVLDAGACRSATFYSISNCQPGLRGFAFGNALLGRAIETLRIQLPRLTMFATVSPIPGFRSWLSRRAGHPSNGARDLATLVARLAEPGWHTDQAAAAQLKAQLVPLCVGYLLYAKEGREPADPVARFHLANGARLQRVNWLSDVSHRGLDRSFGFTANYVYQPANLPRNCETYRTSSSVVTTRQLERLSKRLEL